MDPLDGSLIIDVNVSVGIIFHIYRRVTPAGRLLEERDFLQKGEDQVAACNIIYRTSTMLVCRFIRYILSISKNNRLYGFVYSLFY
tara:strand:- start:507 stop:764 length:258 start_codon:yes stop_codon:yes gene_type:complete